jgi:molecular chaperone DnaK
MTDTASIGIDLGTTNSAIALAEADELDVLPNENGDRLTPSVVAFDGQTANVGREAANQSAQYPEQTVHSVKQWMGTDQEIMLGENGHKSGFTPEELSALILKKLTADAESTLGRSIESAVITVPAYFNDGERQATKHAGEIAGLDVERIINEPTAACLAHGLRTGEEKAVLVYDLGGGTFDVSLIEINDGIFEVNATNGDTDLGGDDWDAAIVEWLVEQIEREYGVSVGENPATDERLFEAAKQAKHDLSSRQRAKITLPFLEIGGETYDVDQTLTRGTFEQLTQDLTAETIDICEELFSVVEYGPQAVDEVLLVGGSTRMPQIQQRVADHFGREPSKRINPDEAVALGAAAQSAIINQQALPTPNTAGGDVSAGHDESSGDGQPPATRDAEDIVLLDVTPQSLGVEAVENPQTMETVYQVLIPRNTPIPAQEEEVNTTVEDNQKHVEISVYQGEGTLQENELLDEFVIGPIPPRPIGEPNIKIEFELDQDGLLQVRAEDVDHEIGDDLEIESVFGLTRDEIDAMQQNLPALR